MKKNTVNIRPYTKQFYRGNIGYFSLAMLASLIGCVGALLVSWLLREITDMMSGYGTRFDLSGITLIAIIAVGISILSNVLQYFSTPSFVTRAISQYKEYVFAKIIKKNISAFSSENTSTYISALTNDLTTVETGYLQNIFTLTESLATFVGALAIMLIYSPTLTLVAVVLSLLPLAASILTGNRLAHVEREVSDKNEAYTSSLKDALSGFAVIKAFKAEAQMLRLFGENVAELARSQKGRQRARILVTLFSSAAGITAQLGVFIVGAYLSRSDASVTGGTTLIFVQLMNFIINPIAVIPTCIAERRAARALVEKLALSLEVNSEDKKPCRNITLSEGVTVKDLSFSYESDKPVLKNISCTFEHGKKYALVGASGSGKSTLLNLLMSSSGTYEGEILYDGTELREIDVGELYEIESVIRQNVFVFNATIGDNITMFRDFAPDEVERAIKLSGLSELIAERGADYLCGENGSGLSGGEKQRVSIARSLLKRSKLLLADEATSALDAETARQIGNVILDLEDVTALVVTHTLDAGLLERYDGIFVLKGGSIIESGTFEELMAEKGYFYSLFTVSH